MHKSADAIDNFQTKSSNKIEPTAPKSTYWAEYKIKNPNKAAPIECLLEMDISSYDDKDVREKIDSVDRLSKGLKCSIDEIKSCYLDEIEKYPPELIPRMIKTTEVQIQNEANMYHISEDNTSAAIMLKMLKERQKELGSPDADITRDLNEQEKEIAKALFSLPLDEEELNERIKSLREMSVLLKCPMEELRKKYEDDIRKTYDGKYENFPNLIDAYKHMAFQAYEVSPRMGVQPRNTDYGIMCEWLSDIMKAERRRFMETEKIKCIYCGSTNVKLGLFDTSFKCYSCYRDFGGV